MDKTGTIMDDYTAGNGRGDSQLYLDFDEGVGIEEMRRMAASTGAEMASEHGVGYTPTPEFDDNCDDCDDCERYTEIL